MWVRSPPPQPICSLKFRPRWRNGSATPLQGVGHCSIQCRGISGLSVTAARPARVGEAEVRLLHPRPSSKAGVAQRKRRRTQNADAVGSNPAAGTMFGRVAQRKTRAPQKRDVGGSNPSSATDGGVRLWEPGSLISSLRRVRFPPPLRFGFGPRSSKRRISRFQREDAVAGSARGIAFSPAYSNGRETASRSRTVQVRILPRALPP